MKKSTFMKRVLGQEGVNGVVVALLLVLVGVASIAAINSFVTDTSDQIITDTNTTVQNLKVN